MTLRKLTAIDLAPRLAQLFEEISSEYYHSGWFVSTPRPANNAHISATILHSRHAHQTTLAVCALHAKDKNPEGSGHDLAPRLVVSPVGGRGSRSDNGKNILFVVRSSAMFRAPGAVVTVSSTR